MLSSSNTLGIFLLAFVEEVNDDEFTSGAFDLNNLSKYVCFTLNRLSDMMGILAMIVRVWLLRIDGGGGAGGAILCRVWLNFGDVFLKLGVESSAA